MGEFSINPAKLPQNPILQDPPLFQCQKRSTVGDQNPFIFSSPVCICCLFFYAVRDFWGSRIGTHLYKHESDLLYHGSTDRHFFRALNCLRKPSVTPHHTEDPPRYHFTLFFWWQNLRCLAEREISCACSALLISSYTHSSYVTRKNAQFAQWT